MEYRGTSYPGNVSCKNSRRCITSGNLVSSLFLDRGRLGYITRVIISRRLYFQRGSYIVDVKYLAKNFFFAFKSSIKSIVLSMRNYESILSGKKEFLN